MSQCEANTSSQIGQRWPWTECRSRLRLDSAFFFRTRIRSQKFVKNQARIWKFSVRSMITGVWTGVENYSWIDDRWSLNRSRILKFEKFSDPDQDSKILEQERSRSLKKWLRPPLL